MKSHAKPPKRLTRDESDARRIDDIAQQLEQQEQEQLIERLVEHWRDLERWRREEMMTERASQRVIAARDGGVTWPKAEKAAAPNPAAGKT